MHAEPEVVVAEGLSPQAEDLLIAALTMSGCYAESGSRRTAMLTARYLRALADHAGPGLSDRVRDACEGMALRWSQRASRGRGAD